MYNRRKATGRRGLAFLLAVVMLAGCMGMTAFAEEALGETIVDEAELGGDAAGAVLPEGSSPDVTEGERTVPEPVPEETVPEETAEGPELPEAEEQVVEEETGTDVDETVSFEAKSSLDEDFTGICAEGSGNYAQPDDADPSALVQGYFEKELGLIRLRGPLNPTRDMTVLQAAVYEELLQCVRETAAGERSSTVYRVAFEDPDLLTWTAEELGYPEFNNENLGAAVERIFQNELSFDIIHTALLNVCPFELYWYDKTVGVRYSFSYMIPSPRTQSLSLTDLTYTFCVASEYADGQNTERVKAGTGEAIRAAANRANSIVNDCTETNDAERLRYYRDAVCALTDYNYAAAAGGVPYGNPWQLIWVFDGNPETRVVCEGYSKAFQLLCDLTRQRGLFRASSTNCISVSGTMNGGNHMWNLVSMDDGANYLADVTNCDEGETGSDRLFLRGYEEKIGDRQYTVGGITYLYNGETVSYYPPDVLALSAADWKESYYPITVDDTDPNGRVTAPESACSQELVTLTVTPAEGYALAADGLRVTYVDSDYTVHAVEVTQGTGENADRWSFIMPSAPVRITAVFTSIAHSGTWGDLSWTLDGAGKLTISGAGEMYDFYNTSDDAWRQYKADIKTACLTAGVTSIGAYAFRGCSNLTEIVIPEGITSIGDYAFYNCSSLSNMAIPYSVTDIQAAAFLDCIHLDEIRFLGAPPSIGSDTFTGVSADAFYPADQGWTSENMKNYGGDLTWIPAADDQSGSCGENLTWTLENGNLTISGTGQMPDYFGDDAPWYSERSQIVTLTVSEGVTGIGEYAFYDCCNLTRASLPEGLTGIGRYAFLNCSGLTSITIPKSAAQMSPNMFAGCTGLQSAGPIGSGSNLEFGWTEEIPACAFGNCRSLKRITIPEGITSIGAYAIADCSDLEKIVVPASVTSLGAEVFQDCTGLQSAGPIGSGCDYEFAWTEALPEGAFSGCGSLTRVSIPEGIRDIGEQAFSYCSALTEVSIPASVTSIDREAFVSCDQMNAIRVAAGSSAFSDIDGVLYDRNQKTVVRCPEGKTGSYTIPSGVTAIGDSAFLNSALTAVIIPESVEEIGYAAFFASSLADISIPAGVTYIHHECFRFCRNLTGIRMPDSIDFIGSYSFEGCESLTKITIPKAVTVIGNNAFADCIQLSEIRFRGASPFIDSDAFDHVTATAAYPSNQGWTDEDRQDYGGTITWVQINVEAQLQEISDNSDSMNADEIRSAAQDLDRDSLKEAMETDLGNNGVVASMKELDEKLGGTEVKVAPEMAGSFSPDDIDVTGAQLNTPEAADTPIRFVLDKPKNNDVVPAMYNSSIAVRFSMDLENTDTSGILDVPVKVTLPIPAGINPAFLAVLHYHIAGDEPEAIIPYVFYENGKPYASFVLSSFSDFIFTEERTEEEISFQTTLNLADYTGIFVYIGLPEGADASAYTVEASYHSYRQNYTKGPIALNTLPKGSGARAGMYKFEPLRAASTELSDTVTVTLKKDGAVVKTEEYSVRGIAEARLAAGEVTGDAATLHRALLQYGRYGQLVFNNRTDDLPGTEGAPALLPIPAGYAAKGDPTNFSAYVTKFEGKLDLNSAISMNLYLTPAKGYSRDSFQISVLDKDGNAYSKYSVTTDSSNRIRVRIEGILSPQMARNFRVVVTLKSNPARTATWTRSVLSCAYTTEQTNTNANVKSLMQALYQYYVYAARVFPQFV